MLKALGLRVELRPRELLDKSFEPSARRLLEAEPLLVGLAREAVEAALLTNGVKLLLRLPGEAPPT